MLASLSELRRAYREGRFAYILSGAMRLSQGIDNGRGAASLLHEEVELGAGEFAYILSGTTRLAQGQDNGRVGLLEAQELTVGLVGYPRSGQRRAGQRKE